jgi:cystathionine beta-synthase
MVPVITLPPNAPIETANKIMHEKSISQIPVVDDGKVIGTVSSDSLAGAVIGSHIKIKTVQEALVRELPMMNEDTPISIISETLNQFHAILATRTGEIVGIVTSEDVLRKSLKDH